MRNRKFLLSLLMVPACGPNVPTEGDDPREPDGGNPEKLEESCRAFYDQYLGCYGDYASSGASYETAEGGTGDYDPTDYADELCGNAAQYAEQYGPECAGAMEEAFACLSSVECDELLDDDGAGRPDACDAVFLDASQRCPGLISQCSVLGVGNGLNTCEAEASGCIDGRTYDVRCEASGATQSCTCSIDGEVTRQESIGGELECQSRQWSDEVVAACEFPPGVF